MSDLSELKPTEKRRVIDLVEAAGVDVSDWSNVKGGSKRAAVNPKYCYDWAFVQPGKVVVLNLWHGQMRPRRGTIVVDLDFRRYAQKRAQGKGRAVWRQRSARMDNAIRVAFTHGLPVRVVVIDGTRRSWNDANARASSVARRELDPDRWSVTAYDSRTGQGLLMRGASPKGGTNAPLTFLTSAPPFKIWLPTCPPAFMLILEPSVFRSFPVSDVESKTVTRVATGPG